MSIRFRRDHYVARRAESIKTEVQVCYDFTGSELFQTNDSLIGWTTYREVEGEFKTHFPTVRADRLDFIAAELCFTLFWRQNRPIFQKIADGLTFLLADTRNKLFLEALFTLYWCLMFLENDWVMFISTFQRGVLSRCEYEQTQ